MKTPEELQDLYETINLNNCHCERPIIRCDNRGCNCERCGKSERLDIETVEAMFAPSFPTQGFVD